MCGVGNICNGEGNRQGAVSTAELEKETISTGIRQRGAISIGTGIQYNMLKIKQPPALLNATVPVVKLEWR